MKNNILDRVIKKYTEENYLINKVNKGYAHNKWIISVDKGQQLFLKEFKDISYDRIEFVNYIQERLKEFSPKIIKSRENKMIVIENNSVYVAYKLINGDTINKKDILDNEIYAIGKFLGRLHKNMREINISDKLTERTSIKIGENNLKEMLTLLEVYENEKKLEYVEIIRYKMELIRQIPKIKIEQIKKQLTKQIVHGDFYLDNIIVAKNKLTVVDLDNTCVFYKMYEVIRGMMMIAFDEDEENNKNIKKTINFLKGYKEENILENMEMSIDLYEYILANSLYCLNIDDYNDTEKKKFALNRYHMLKWLDENKRILINNLEREEIEK